MNLILNTRSYLNFLSRNKGYTAIDLFGLSISLMFVLLIAVYTAQELSTDISKRTRNASILLEMKKHLRQELPFPIC